MGHPESRGVALSLFGIAALWPFLLRNSRRAFVYPVAKIVDSIAGAAYRRLNRRKSLVRILTVLGVVALMVGNAVKFLATYLD